MTIKKPIRDVDIVKTWCLEKTLNFTRYFFKKKHNKKFIVNHHHQDISRALDDVLAGRITHLIINVAPRYTKTELVVKNFIANGFAINPKCKFIHLSYSEALARDNSADVLSIMNMPEYRQLFEARPVGSSSKKWYTEQGGGMYAVSSSGQVTGFGAGVVDPEEDEREAIDFDEMAEFFPGEDSDFAGAIILDDPIKPDDAISDLKRQKVNQKFETTIRNRVNSRKTPIIIIMQRLHENDLCGYLQELEPDEWTVVSLPCIYKDEKGEDRALWPHKHTLEELRKIEQANSFVFETQYMQNPTPVEGLMYEPFKTYEYGAIPYTASRARKNYTDTADEGADYLCSICYDETPIGCYVTDVLYTKKPMEFTEPKMAEMVVKNNTQYVKVESNNGGRSFARAVEKQVRLMGNRVMKFKWFHQSDNKHVRIFTNAATVNNMIYMPSDWKTRWPEFYKHVTSYRKEGNNAHDDAPDALTGIVENMSPARKSLAGYV